jgi:invasion protein IalB
MMVKKETLDRFKNSNDLNLEYIGTNGQKININFGLDGFTKEFKKIS